MSKYAFFLLCVMFPFSVLSAWFGIGEKTSIEPAGNHYSQSFYAVKKTMLDKIYYDHKRTLYCKAEFNNRKKIKLPEGFRIPDLKKADFKVFKISQEELEQRSARMEWEHIVPAENFGRTFPEWSKGHKNCTSNKGKKYKGRSCAEQESEAFRYMYTDMYNLYPSVGLVNYLRGNFNFTQFSKQDNVKNIFGSCEMKISRNKAEPPDNVKGLIARTYFYMEQTYPRYKIGEPMRAILKTWNKIYPVTRWECKRAYRIEKIQGNANKIVKAKCQNKGFYRDVKEAR